MISCKYKWTEWMFERICNMKAQIYFYERAENHKAKKQMFKSFKWANFPGKHPDAGVDQLFLEWGCISIILMHLQMQRDVWLDNIINLRQCILRYTVTNLTSLHNVTFHSLISEYMQLASGFMQLAAPGCIGATKYLPKWKFLIQLSPKGVGVCFADFILNIPWKLNNLVSVRPNYFIFIGYLIARRGSEPPLDLPL